MILTGCVRVPPVTLCDGTNAYELSRPGSARNYVDCRNKAAGICGGKYKELDKDEIVQVSSLNNLKTHIEINQSICD